MRQLQLTFLIAFLLLNLFTPLAATGEEVILTAVGDIMLDGSARPVYRKFGYSFPFAATRDILKGSHIAIGNLEAPITGRGNEYIDKRFRFRAPPETAKSLRDAGFLVLTLANNHILDYGAQGLADTVLHLKANGIKHTGAGENLATARAPAIVETRGKRIAFLAYSLTFPKEFFAGPARQGTAPGYAASVSNDIKAARQQADHVVVSFHWGRELAATPKPYQVRAARLAIDSGADIVLGHHPHVLQGVERYRNGVIFYSLGNFAFGSASHASDRSIIARITLDRGVSNVEVIPLNVLNRETRYQPTVLSGVQGHKLIARLNGLSKGMNVVFSESGGRFMLSGTNRPMRFASR
ncbi:capsule biosynthesis protein CapA [Geobacter sp. OR-1]|uniref:CapA family protein n=1 Tax=Geobacter sp. OR-1 TaxID=1266765 RepID=UPI0005427E2D|nr:CapA family protein [Geobacter sp. OR-1]GAM10929.1 capsule biosynthesis protein CapA [Geobacter sp. OR-1]